MRATIGPAKTNTSAPRVVHQTNDKKMRPTAIVNGGHTLRLSAAFLFRKKKALEAIPSAIHITMNTGNTEFDSGCDT